MPHPAEFKKAHSKVGYEDPALCSTCHARSAAETKGLGSCNACHHPGSKPDQAWQQQHPSIVKKEGADECFECHEETYCSRCHVRVSSTLQ